MSNIKLKNHYWHARSVFDPTQNKTQEAINAQSAELIASSTVASTGTTGATAATFTANAAGLPLKSLVVTLPDATQEGSGDPSPANIRRISGVKSFTIYQSGADTSDPTSINTWLALTAYGGTVDVAAGKQIVDRVGIRIKDINWTYNNNHSRFQANNWIPAPVRPKDQKTLPAGLLCECYKAVAVNSLSDNQIAISQSNTAGTLMLKHGDPNIKTQTALKEAVGEYLIVYPLAEPIVLPIKPINIATLEGTNKIWASCGTVSVAYGEYAQAAKERAESLSNYADSVAGYITPEQFGAVGDGIADDHEALQACLNHGGAILFSREYNIRDAQLVANKQIELVCTSDSKIIADPFDFSKGKLPSAVLTLTAEKSRVYGMRVFSRIVFDSQGSANNVYSTYIEVNRSETASGAGSNRYALFVNAPRCVIRDLYGEYCSLIRLDDHNHEGCVIDGLYGEYVEIGIYAAIAKNVVVNNVRINVSKYVLSDYYHVFYFCNPENCAFSNVVVGASGEVNKDGSPYINSDIFHFNFSFKGTPPPLGGDVVVINATIIDGCFKRLTQVNDNVRAYFANCTGKFTDTICLIGASSSEAEGEPSATFTGCNFTITDGNSNAFGFRCTAEKGRVWLRDCKIIDDSTDGYLISGGVVADGCTLEAKKWNINVSSASTSPKFVKFHNCVIKADALYDDGISPAKPSPNTENFSFSTEYHNCKFVFDTAPSLLIANDDSTALVIGGSVENCSNIYSGSDSKVTVISLPYKSNGAWHVFSTLSGGT